jgi:hypothetical protein
VRYAFLIGYVVCKGIVLACFLLAGCSAFKLSPQDESELAQRDAQEAACIAALKPNKQAIDDCRQKVKEYWNQRWNARFDGGF